MASVITATNSSGLTTSADNSGVLQLASGTGNLVTVPSVTGTAMVSGNMPAFSATPSGNQGSISNATNTKITFDTEEFDTGGCFNNTGSTVTLNGISTPSYSFAPNVAGYYQVSIGSAIATTTNNYGLFTLLYKNNSAYRYGTSGMSNGAMYCQSANSFLVYLNGTSDYIAAYVYGSVGGTFALVGAYTYFSAVMVRGA